MHTPKTNCIEQLAFEDCIQTPPDRRKYGYDKINNVTINESYFMQKLKTTPTIGF